MYLHLGNDFMVNTKEIIGIFDIENTSVSKITKDFLNESAKKKHDDCPTGADFAGDFSSGLRSCNDDYHASIAFGGSAPPEF